MLTNKRVTLVLISMPKDSEEETKVLELTRQFESDILASVQAPDNGGDELLFGILMKISTDDLGAFTGPIGRLKDVRVKSAVLPEEKK